MFMRVGIGVGEGEGDVHGVSTCNATFHPWMLVVAAKAP